MEVFLLVEGGRGEASEARVRWKSDKGGIK